MHLNLRMGLFFILFVIMSTNQVSCKSIGRKDQIIFRGEEKVMPEWVKQEIGDTYSDEAPTTKRAPIGEIIGQQLQGILQGIVKAPSDIANRVQDILDGILRRPSTAVPIIGASTSPPATKRV